MGASAGATSSLWIGLQDDLSDKKSKDPSFVSPQKFLV